MGIFDFFKKPKKKVVEFEEQVVTTENVPETLLEISKKYKLPLSSLDFEILDVKTFVKMGNTGFAQADEETMKLIQNENFLIDKENEVKQSYDIKIKKFKPDPDFELMGDMKINEKLTYAEFVVLKNSKLKADELQEKLIHEFNKKKLKNSFLIDLCDDIMKHDVTELVSAILIEEKLEKDFVVKLCKCLDPIMTIQGKVEYLYKKNKKQQENLLIYPVKKGEVIIRVIKPQEGRNGRNCKGEILLAGELKDFDIPNIDFDENTIKRVEDTDKIDYIALKDGYVEVEDDKYFVKDQLEIRQVNIRTGNIKGADETEVKMKIKESDFLKEAIADGMVVETTELNIKGNIGNKSKVKAKILTIEGQTHQNSQIIAQKAEINVHKGYLKGKEVTINSLENGKVVADKVFIKRALGGEVEAKEVEIETLMSHTKIYALKHIKIKSLRGEENILCISPKKVLKDTDIKTYEAKLEEVRKNIEKITQEREKLKKILAQNKKAYLELKTLYEKNKKNGVKSSNSLIVKLKKYQDLNKKYQTFGEKIESLKLKEEELLDTIDNIQNAIYNAKIINCSKWTPFNRIEFELLEPPVTLRYDTKDEGVCGFKLRFEEAPKIVKIKVDNDCSSEG